ncbi:MAG: hypothetical protein Kow0099_22200 [Candidatus Abyssubacteria bacterium]
MVPKKRGVSARKEYLHAPLHVPMEMGASSYWITSEEKLGFQGRDVLFIVRDTDCITSCCGQSQGFRSIGVVGYIIEWRCTEREGMSVSIVEPVVDQVDREQILRQLRDRYKVTQVEFLSG